MLVAVALGAWIGHEVGRSLGDRLTPDTGLLLLRGQSILMAAWLGAAIGAVAGGLGGWVLGLRAAGPRNRVGLGPSSS